MSAITTKHGSAKSLEALERQLREAANTIADLRNQDALKTEFLVNISHDLRTPLSAVVTHAEMLRDGILGELSDRQRESVCSIISGGRQLLEMIGEILTYARGAAGRLALSRTRFTVDDVMAEVVLMSQPLIASKEHNLAIEIEPSLPPLFADREKIAHVISNLLANAINYTPAGGRLWIKARSATTPDGSGAEGVEVEVGDTGIGIAREHHELIFREFAQVDSSASRTHHGTGLGLAIARKFIELHGGRIWLDSILGNGSRFLFTIPPYNARGSSA